MSEISPFVIGTAGHIDHGKSSLIRALTGINPDRLKEEQEREMTIDLGFAYLTLPSGRRVSIVDVPGHERFIKNMLAGATGIDLVLFCVAADEGMMPQSREHLDILNLLGLKNGVVVVTKRDLVDEDWYQLIVEDIKEELAGTFLEGAPMVAVSSRTGEGLDELKVLIDSYADRIEERPRSAPARFPVDRVFTIAGFGTVLTGTLWEGTVRVGQELELLPQGVRVRVRNLQTHKEDVQEASAAVRLAINITGAERSAIKRGDVLAEPGYFAPSTSLDVKISLLDDAPLLTHAEQVHFYHATTETIARVRLLYTDELKPGESAYAQVVLGDPVIARRGDRFVIRRFSPLVTIGGGTVLSPRARRRRRFEDRYREELEKYETASDKDFMEYAVLHAGFEGISTEELKMASSLREDRLKELLTQFESSGTLFSLGGRWFHASVDRDGAEAIKAELTKFFAGNPWATGMDREELRSRAGIEDRKLYSRLLSSLTSSGAIVVEQDLVRLAGRKAELSPEDRKLRSQIENAFVKDLFNPPLPEDVWNSFAGKERRARQLFDTLVEDKIIVKVAADTYMHRKAIREAQTVVREFIAKHGSMTVGQLRDALKTSRRYAVPLMEYFDKIRFTKRVGDTRVLVSEQAAEER